MPVSNKLISVIGITAFAATISVSALADETNYVETDMFSSGFYASANLGASWRDGSTTTTNGGQSKDGISHDVTFQRGYSAGLELGYLPASELSYFLSYDYIDGEVKFLADFGATLNQKYGGKAVSQVILANVAYAIDLHEKKPPNLRPWCRCLAQ